MGEVNNKYKMIFPFFSDDPLAKAHHLEACTYADRGTPLGIAAKAGHAAACKALLDARADPSIHSSLLNGMQNEPSSMRRNMEDYSGTPLGLAVIFGHQDVVTCLLEGSAAVAGQCCYWTYHHRGGGPILFAAAALGHIEILKALLSAGFNTNEVGHLEDREGNSEKMTPLQALKHAGHCTPDLEQLFD